MFYGVIRKLVYDLIGFFMSGNQVNIMLLIIQSVLTYCRIQSMPPAACQRLLEKARRSCLEQVINVLAFFLTPTGCVGRGHILSAMLGKCYRIVIRCHLEGVDILTTAWWRAALANDARSNRCQRLCCPEYDKPFKHRSLSSGGYRFRINHPKDHLGAGIYHGYLDLAIGGV